MLVEALALLRVLLELVTMKPAAWHALDPGFGRDFVPVREQSVQIERGGAGTLRIRFRHRMGPP